MASQIDAAIYERKKPACRFFKFKKRWNKTVSDLRVSVIRFWSTFLNITDKLVINGQELIVISNRKSEICITLAESNVMKI